MPMARSIWSGDVGRVGCHGVLPLKRDEAFVAAQVQWGTLGEWAAGVGALLLIGVTVWLWSKDRAERDVLNTKAEACDQAAEVRAQDAERRAQDAEGRAQEAERRAHDEERRRAADEERLRAHSLVAWLTTEPDPNHVPSFGSAAGRLILRAHVLNTGSEVIREWALVVKHRGREFQPADLVMLGLLSGVVAPGQEHNVWLISDIAPTSPVDAEVTLNFRDGAVSVGKASEASSQRSTTMEAP